MAFLSKTKPVSGAAIDPRPALFLLLAVTFITCSLGWLLKGECAFDGRWDNLEFYAKGCYSDAYPFWRERHLAEGLIPYFQTQVEYPVLTGALIFLEQRWTHFFFGPDAGDPDFVFVVSATNTVFALFITRMLWGLRLAPARLWAWALAPLLVLYVGHNWDLLAVALAVGAFVAAERGWPVRACALAALGVAAKLFPVVLLPLFALRRLEQRRIVEVIILALVSVGVWLAVNLPVALAAPDNWWQFYQFSADRDGTRAALWDFGSYYHVFITDIPMRNLLSALMFGGGMVAILMEGWPRYKDRLWLLATPVILLFLLTSKVYSPQFDLWAYPFMLITSRRWQPIALFALGDAACYFGELWYLAGLEGGHPSVPMETLLIAALLRAFAMGWLIRDALVLPLPDWLERSGAGDGALPVPAPAT